MKKHALHILPIMLFIFVMWPHDALHAQTDGSSGSIDLLFDQINRAQDAVQQTKTQNISLQVSPRTPGANEEITVAVSGFGSNLNEFFYTWTVNGTRVASGYGVTSIQTIVGDVGERTHINVSMQTRDGNTVERGTVLVPQSIDILWEAVDAHTSPFYRGKALPSYDSTIKLTALSSLYDQSGVAVNPSSVTYRWEKNGRGGSLAQYSGYGGNTAQMTANFSRREHRASVEIIDDARSIRAFKSVNITLHDPDVVFYERHPLNGIEYENALTDTITTNESLRIIAEPYYMDQNSPFDISYTWTMNNSTLTNQPQMDRGEIQLIAEPDQRGRSLLEVEARNDSRILQNDSQTLEIEIE